MSLRPILKRANNLDTPHHRNHAVHFPPPTSLTHTFIAHSASTYDRSPIVVTPNHCALPERGCPGRTYGLDDSPTPPKRSSLNSPQCYSQNGRAYHPRALALGSRIHHDDHVSDDFRCDDRQSTPVSLPPLVPDTSSESDESDGSSFTPSDVPYTACASSPFSGYPISDTGLSINTSDTFPYLSYSSCKFSNVLNASNTPSALSFLPHPPSPPRQHFYTSNEDEIVRKPRRSRSRRRDRSRDRDRSRESDDDYYYDELDPLPFQPPPPKRLSPSRKDKPLSLSKAMSILSFQDQDSGCLGGF